MAPVDVSVVFDYHHAFIDHGLTYREFERAAGTWDGVRPATHYSEPARLHGEESARRLTPSTSRESPTGCTSAPT